MGDKSYAWANQILNDLRSQSLQVALYTTLPDKNDSGGVEVSAPEYQRQSITLSVPSNGQCANTAEILFPEATSAWGTVVGFGIRVVGGALRYVDTFTGGPVTVSAGQQLRFKAGQLQVQES
jgi:hypothetical protein